MKMKGKTLGREKKGSCDPFRCSVLPYRAGGFALDFSAELRVEARLIGEAGCLA